MKKAKLYLKSFLFTIMELALCLFIISLLYYYSLLDSNAYSFFSFITILLLFLINSFLLGKKVKTKRPFIGLKYGIIIDIIIIILTLILKRMEISNIIYYLIILFTTTLGGIFGSIKRKTTDLSQ